MYRNEYIGYDIAQDLRNTGLSHTHWELLKKYRAHFTEFGENYETYTYSVKVLTYRQLVELKLETRNNRADKPT